MNYDTWVLDDRRAGTTNQAIALASEISENYKIIDLKYNFLSFLPNIFFHFNLFHIDKQILNKLKLLEFPKLIITAGRRNAPLALYLKKISKGQTKAVQIMKPCISPNKFDFIILPEHDGVHKNAQNTIYIKGALCKSEITYDQTLFNKDYPNITDFIGVLIGGSSKKYKFTINEAKELARCIKALNCDINLPLFITFSRRTPQYVKEYIKSTFENNNNIVYDFQKNKYNPYSGILKNAKILITTADSVSICSEVASTGKPFYIFITDNFNSRKHKIFARQLFSLKIAKRLQNVKREYEDYTYPPLKEAKRVAQIIMSKLSLI